MSTAENSAPEAEKKQTKAERLATALVAAKAVLANARARLQPQIEAAGAKLMQLQRDVDSAQQARRDCYHNASSAREKLAATIETPALRAELKAFAVAHGLQHANVTRMERVYVDGVVGADPEVQRLNTLHQAAIEAANKADRALHSFDTVRHLHAQLSGFECRVEELEKQIERLPKKRQADRDRRAGERQKELEERDTEAALAVLGEFVPSGARK